MRCTKAIFAMILAVVCLFSIPATVVYARPDNFYDEKGNPVSVESEDGEVYYMPGLLAEKMKEFARFFRKSLQNKLSIHSVTFSSPLEKYGDDVELRSWFGSRESINGITSSYHGGIDLGASYGNSSLGMDVCAAADGIVVLAEWTNYGNTVVIQHIVNGEYINTLYGHMVNEQRPKASNNTESDPPLVKVGQVVRKGDIIGHIGMTYGELGYATGPHLHFEMRRAENFCAPFGEKIDPADYIDFRSVHIICWDA